MGEKQLYRRVSMARDCIRVAWMSYRHYGAGRQLCILLHAMRYGAECEFLYRDSFEQEGEE